MRGTPQYLMAEGLLAIMGAVLAVLSWRQWFLYDKKKNDNFQSRRKGSDDRRDFSKEEKPEPRTDLIIGRNAVRELLRSGRDVDKILVHEPSGKGAGANTDTGTYQNQR